jgi:hypothetical protein
MAVLTADKQVTYKHSEIAAYAMADNVHLYKGALICVNSSGYAVDATEVSAISCVGVAYENVDNTVTGHTAGGRSIRVQSGKTFLLGATGMSQAAVGQAAFLVDDQTVGLAPQSPAIFVGIIRSYVSSTSVWVYIPETDASMLLGGLIGGGTGAKTVKVALTGGTDTGGGIGSWVNPETGSIWIDRCVVSSQGTGGHIATAACNLDAGTTATSATTLSDNLIDGLDIHTALITADNISNPGANGKSSQVLASGKWVTFSMADAGASAGFVGEAFISYRVL